MLYSIQFSLLNNKRTYQNFTNNFNTFLTQFLFHFNTILTQKVLIFDFSVSESLENTGFLFLVFKCKKRENIDISTFSRFFSGGEFRFDILHNMSNISNSIRLNSKVNVVLM